MAYIVALPETSNSIAVFAYGLSGSWTLYNSPDGVTLGDVIGSGSSSAGIVHYNAGGALYYAVVDNSINPVFTGQVTPTGSGSLYANASWSSSVFYISWANAVSSVTIDWSLDGSAFNSITSGCNYPDYYYNEWNGWSDNTWYLIRVTDGTYSAYEAVNTGFRVPEGLGSFTATQHDKSKVRLEWSFGANTSTINLTRTIYGGATENMGDFAGSSAEDGACKIGSHYTYVATPKNGTEVGPTTTVIGFRPLDLTKVPAAAKVATDAYTLNTDQNAYVSGTAATLPDAKYIVAGQANGTLALNCILDYGSGRAAGGTLPQASVLVGNNGTLDLSLYTLKSSVVAAAFVVEGHSNHAGGDAGLLAKDHILNHGSGATAGGTLPQSAVTTDYNGSLNMALWVLKSQVVAAAWVVMGHACYVGGPDGEYAGGGTQTTAGDIFMLPKRYRFTVVNGCGETLAANAVKIYMNRWRIQQPIKAKRFIYDDEQTYIVNASTVADSASASGAVISNSSAIWEGGDFVAEVTAPADASGTVTVYIDTVTDGDAVHVNDAGLGRSVAEITVDGIGTYRKSFRL